MNENEEYDRKKTFCFSGMVQLLVGDMLGRQH